MKMLENTMDVAAGSGSVHRLVLLDLFCCEGGAGEGYRRAGFDVVGVDIEDKSGRNPHRFIQGDALEYLAAHGHEYDIIHASPPCQSYSKNLKHMATPKPMLIEPLMAILKSIGKPWIVENVDGAPLATRSENGRHGVMLCGTMFGKRVYRHRLFETTFPIVAPRPCDHSQKAMNPFKDEGWHRIREEFGTKDTPEKVWRHEMGLHWMSKQGAREAVPPVFTEYVGREFLKQNSDYTTPIRISK
jgi:DNA (cytosine-5)-methyltransferase 1